jgi:DNA-binding transcriptional regulator YiaG
MVYTSAMTPKEIKTWRKQNNYSQSQLAKVLSVNVMTISRWERGVRAIPSFLHLTLECLEKKGGELKAKGKKTKKERKVRKHGRQGKGASKRL